MSIEHNFHINLKVKQGAQNNLFCLHGFAEDSSTWDKLTLTHYNIFGVDFFGHGNSPAPKELTYYFFDNVINTLHKQINSLCTPPYTLLGYSMGGRLALYYALKYQDELQALILESAGLGIKNEEERKIRQSQDEALAENILSKGIMWFEKHWASQSIFKSQNKLDEETKAKIKTRRISCNTLGLANSLRGMGQGICPYLGEMANSLDLPILYLAGEQDKKYLQMGQDFAKSNSQVKLFCVPKAGHNIHTEQAQIFQTKIEEFLEKTIK